MIRKVDIIHEAFGKIGEGYAFEWDVGCITVWDIATNHEIQFSADTKKTIVPFLGECRVVYVSEDSLVSSSGMDCCKLTGEINNVDTCMICGKKIE
ncbi:hypothetical protein ACFL2R_02810 [Patescibacteria group bacterium]